MNRSEPPESGACAEVAAHLSTTLVQTIKTIKLHTRTLPRAHPDIDYSTLPLLHVLAHEPHRISALAEAVHCDISGVSRQVTTLVGTGFVEKVPDPADGRASLVALTEAGEEFVHSLRTKRAQWFGELLADWSPEEMQEFDRLLEKFAASLLAYEKTTLPAQTEKKDTL